MGDEGWVNAQLVLPKHPHLLQPSQTPDRWDQGQREKEAERFQSYPSPSSLRNVMYRFHITRNVLKLLHNPSKSNTGGHFILKKTLHMRENHNQNPSFPPNLFIFYRSRDRKLSLPTDRYSSVMVFVCLLIILFLRQGVMYSGYCREMDFILSLDPSLPTSAEISGMYHLTKQQLPFW